MNGEPVRSCTTACSEAAGKDILTIEGLGNMQNPHPIQQSFIEEQAIQCGFCISGPMLYGKVHVDKNPNTTREEINKALDGVMCRCHAHFRMLNALERYAAKLRAGARP
jgi:nicotinate dehydrogenase subunit A